MDHSNNGRRPGLLAAPQRNNYFYGKLMDVPHFQMEQDYGKRKRWLLNRLGLGSGVLCGLRLSINDNKVCVSPGVAIDAYGREIIVPHEICVDPWTLTEESGHPKSTSLSKTEEQNVYLCLAYKECQTDYMPVLVTDCNTRQECQAGTTVESYCLLVKEVKDGKPPVWKSTIGTELCEKLGSDIPENDKRKELCDWRSTSSCGTPEGEGCVVLGRVYLNEDGLIPDKDNEKNDNPDQCSVRTILVSNEQLLDILFCLGGKAGRPGPQGPPGVSVKTADAETIPAEQPASADFDPVTGNIHFKIPAGSAGTGSDPILTKITFANWMHEGSMSIGTFTEGLRVRFSDSISSSPKFGRGWFLVTVEFPIPALPPGPVSSVPPPSPLFIDNTILTLRVLDSTIDIISTGNVSEAVFHPQAEFSQIYEAVRVRRSNNLPILCRVVIKCNYLGTSKGLVDGNFKSAEELPPGAPSGMRMKVITGDGVPGGDFESWFVLTP